MATKIKSRIEMAQLLHERMNKSYTSLAERQELEPDTTLVKTYLKEVHLTEGSRSEEVFRLAKSVFGEHSRKFSLRVSHTEEDFFFIVDGVVKNEPVTIYIDATNTRFWILHSMNSSIALDGLLDYLVSATASLDHVWMPTHLLVKMVDFGRLRGLSLDYDRRALPDVDFDSDETPVEFLKMQLWGNKASEVLRVLSDDRAFPHEATLSKVKIKHWIDHNNGLSEFSIDDIKYDGKITSRGTSFQSHLSILQKIHASYVRLIEKIESDFQLGHSYANGRFSIHGEPISIIFDRPIANLRIFCQHLFSATEPFRLWGVPTFTGERCARVAAVDLHVGARLNFELTPECIRVYLPSGGCGNSVVRVYTNLQHYYDSLIVATDGNDEPVFH